MPGMAPGAVDIVLFDLGGVLIELGGVRALRELSAIASDDEVWRRWLTCPWVRSFESGRCSAAEFADGVVSDWNLPVTSERFLELFRDWPVGPLPGASDLLAEVQRLLPIGCLSNTNLLHWEHQIDRWPILEVFDYSFLSFDLGLVKPDPAVFAEITDRLPVDPGRVLFLDDNALNTDAARSSGFLAEHVRGVAEARRALVESGVLAAGGDA
jgi:putative hydrolase of the HAD superfamily